MPYVDTEITREDLNTRGEVLPVIQSLWIGHDLTHIEKLCIQSFLDHGHEFHLYTYTHIGGIPEGTIVKDGNEILESTNLFKTRSSSYANFSDWFRYTMLKKNGGFWVDMDVICIKPFDFESDIILSINADGYTNAVIGMPKNHPMMVAIERHCRDYQNKERAGWGAMGGPSVLSLFIRQFEMEKYGKPFMYFTPLPYTNWHFAFDKSFRNGANLYPDTYAVHLYNEMGRKIKLDKNAQFDSESLIEQLKAKHKITPVENAKKITSIDLHNALLQQNTNRAIAKMKKKRKYLYGLLLVISIIMVAFFRTYIDAF